MAGTFVGCGEEHGVGLAGRTKNTRDRVPQHLLIELSGPQRRLMIGSTAIAAVVVPLLWYYVTQRYARGLYY